MMNEKKVEESISESLSSSLRESLCLSLYSFIGKTVPLLVSLCEQNTRT